METTTDIVEVRALEKYNTYLKFSNGEDVAPENLYFNRILLTKKE